MPRDAAALAWMANLGCLELHPASGARGGSRSPRRASHRPRPACPVSTGPQLQAVAGVVRQVLADFGLVGWPKTSGSRGIHVNVRIHRSLVVHAGEARRSGARSRGGAARARPRHQQVVEGGAPRRVPRLQPERQGPHGRRRLLGSPQARCAGFRARDLGGALRVRAGGLHAAHHAGPLRRRRRPARAQSTRARARSTPLLELSARQEADGLGDAPWPPHYAKQAGEPPRVQPSRRREQGKATGRRVPTKPLIEIGRAAKKEEALAGLERWKARHPGIAAHLEAGRRARRLHARALLDVDARAREPRARPAGAAARPGGARSGLRSVARR